MLIVTPQAKQKLVEALHENTHDPCLAIRITINPRAPRQLDLILDKEKRGPGNWASRAGLTALGVVPTGAAEMSLYKKAHYAQPTCHLLRYTLRMDGFVSVNAPYRGGEWVTKPFTFTGRELTLNFSTGAAGSVRVELQDARGAPLPGRALAEAMVAGRCPAGIMPRWRLRDGPPGR